MKTPHKHAEVIKAWADGAEIEYLETMTSKEPYWANAPMPKWSEETMYRVKPEPKPDFIYYGQLDEPARGAFTLGTCFTRDHDVNDKVKLTFDGSTGKLKSVEML
jgi:hypothetical protein